MRRQYDDEIIWWKDYIVRDYIVRRWIVEELYCEKNKWWKDYIVIELHIEGTIDLGDNMVRWLYAKKGLYGKRTIR